VANVTDLPVYESKINEKIEASDANIIVFTSPMNAEGYLRNQQIKSGQKVIAIGNSTGDKLGELGYNDHIIPRIPNELGLLECVFGICSE